MRYKVFGDRTGLAVSEFALGTGMLGKAYGYGTEPEEALKILEGYPCITPQVCTPRECPVRTTARIAAFIPGASPPLVSTARFFINSPLFEFGSCKCSRTSDGYLKRALIAPLLRLTANCV
jgi:hypothetical protein